MRVRLYFRIDRLNMNICYLLSDQEGQSFGDLNGEYYKFGRKSMRYFFLPLKEKIKFKNQDT